MFKCNEADEIGFGVQMIQENTDDKPVNLVALTHLNLLNIK